MEAPAIIATDGELLMRFARHGDKQALGVVVDRHSAMVRLVCTRMLANRHAAEDAYQATFLILAKKASSIRASDSVGGWLFRVAHNTALATRRARKRRREEPLVKEPLTPEEVMPDLAGRQTVAVLIEELRALPERYQTPLVLRYLEGQSRRAIADATDVTVASVAGRLVRGKRMLRQRLARRGVSLAVAVGAFGVASEIDAAEVIHAPLVDPSAPLSAASPLVSHLVHQGVRSMFFASLVKPATAATIAAAAGLLLLVEPMELMKPLNAESQVLLQADVSEAAVANVPLAVAIEASAERTTSTDEQTGVDNNDAPFSEDLREQEWMLDQLDDVFGGESVATYGEAMLAAWQTPELAKLPRQQRFQEAWRRVATDRLQTAVDAAGQQEMAPQAVFIPSQDEDAARIADAKKHYAELAAKDGITDYENPGFEELYWQKLSWNTRLLEGKENAKHLEKFGGEMGIPQAELATRMREAIVGQNQAKAKLAELERKLKQAAVAGQEQEKPRTEPNPLAAKPQAVDHLEELVRSYEQVHAQIAALHEAGAHGGSANKLALAKQKLAMARAQLAAAKGQLAATRDQQQQAIEAAEANVKAQQAAYDAGQVTLDSLLEAMQLRADAKAAKNPAEEAKLKAKELRAEAERTKRDIEKSKASSSASLQSTPSAMFFETDRLFIDSPSTLASGPTGAVQLSAAAQRNAADLMKSLQELDASGRHAEAIKAYEEAIKKQAAPLFILRNNLAHLLATADDESLRDPQRAVALAQQALAEAPRQEYPHIELVDTLAVAQAAAGDAEAARAMVQLQMERAQRDLETLQKAAARLQAARSKPPKAAPDAPEAAAKGAPPKAPGTRENPYSILGPVRTKGQPPIDPPSDKEILSKLGIEMPDTGQSPILRVVKEKISQHTDPARVYPLIGNAEQVHVFYKCSIYGPESDEKPAAVIFIDHYHFFQMTPPESHALEGHENPLSATRSNTLPETKSKWLKLVDGKLVPAKAPPMVDEDQLIDRKPDRPTGRLEYGDGKPDGKKSLGGSGHLIKFEMPEGVSKVKALRIHGSRYGLPKAPKEDFEISFLSHDMSEVLTIERAAYGLFRRGDEKWVTVRFRQPIELPQKFWVGLDFDPGRTKGVYVSYDTSTEGKHSKAGLAAEPEKVKDVDFKGDWMVQVILERDGDKQANKVQRSIDVPSTDRQKQFADWAPAPDSQVHVIGTYSGADGAPLTVEVKETEKPITLVLTAYYWQDWKLKLAEGVKLDRVIVAGYNGQRIAGVVDALPEGTPLEVYTYYPTKQARHDLPRPETFGDRDFFWAYEKTSEEYFDLVDKLKTLTDAKITSFQGEYKAESFTVE